MTPGRRVGQAARTYVVADEAGDADSAESGPLRLDDGSWAHQPRCPVSRLTSPAGNLASRRFTRRTGGPGVTVLWRSRRH